MTPLLLCIAASSSFISLISLEFIEPSNYVQSRDFTSFLQLCSKSTMARDLCTIANSFDFMDMWHVILSQCSVFCQLSKFQRTLQTTETKSILLFSAFGFAVAVSIRYGYYGDCRMVLGPSSSRLIKASSVFVDQVEVRDNNGKGALLYGFSQKPELCRESNWNASNFLIVRSYSRKGYYLWLNKGSRIFIRWATQMSKLDKLEVVMIKGERKSETLLPNLTNSFDALFLNEPVIGKEAEYTIEEDDKYYVGVINSNPMSIIMTFTLNVISKVYDVTRSSNMCSTLNGSCRLKLLFPDTQYVVVSTPDSADLADGWYIELSFLARVVTYIAFLGAFIIIVFLVLKYLGACEGETPVVDTYTREIPWRTETDPILPEKPVHLTYGTTAGEEDDAETGSSSSSSEDLYDAKLCVICYDDQRNCFFVPCGHCATCYDCAQRIMEEESKVCPICRRIIHKVRRLFSP
ncbi:Zinc finger, RING-type [Corchorus capsularis]|uniref:Zinc finger, RING-type n=1 Tax=Corchorus capsularis TaxID=210143 RepID=A0A1R3I8D9_COCAP|nr:Zinc finger, RING-type [Corchorus capsularis]